MCIRMLLTFCYPVAADSIHKKYDTRKHECCQVVYHHNPLQLKAIDIFSLLL